MITLTYEDIIAKAEEFIKFGKDIHFFWIIDKDGFLPVGEVDNTTCANCTGANAECMGCTARVLRMGKIDYY